MSKQKPNQLALSSKEVRKFKRNWQKVLTNQMNQLFIGYDEKAGETERVAAFTLSSDVLQEIASIRDSVKHIVIHLGARKSKANKFVETPNTPYFIPLLQAYTDKNLSHVYAMTWETDPAFLENTSEEEDANSEVDAIPGASAFLFVRSWLEKPYTELYDPFVGIADGITRRVKSYIFSEEESKVILDNIGNGNGKQLLMYMGNGIRVSSHPFAFRPVLEVSNTQKTDVKGNVLSGSSASFFDFSSPCPPHCQQ